MPISRGRYVSSMNFVLNLQSIVRRSQSSIDVIQLIEDSTLVLYPLYCCAMLRLLFVLCTPCSLATEVVGVTSTGASFAASLDSPLRQDELDADQVEGRQLFLAAMKGSLSPPSPPPPSYLSAAPGHEYVEATTWSTAFAGSVESFNEAVFRSELTSRMCECADDAVLLVRLDPWAPFQPVLC